MKKITNKQIGKVLILLGLSIVTVIFLIPYFWMLSNSFKGTKELLMNPKHILPAEFTVMGYETVLFNSPFFIWLRNSLVVTITDVIVIVFTSALVGYIFSKFNFKGKNILFMILLATMMVPEQTTMIPKFLLMNQLKLYNSILSLIIPTFINAFGIYLCKQFCDELPKELIESAKIDGAGDMKIFFRMILPQIKPALGALSIFTFLERWNDYLNPLILLNSVEKMTLPLALSYFSSQHMADLSATMAASALIMIPSSIVFIIFQKQFIKGISMTGMK
ncbi:carbohydrate ABC transporter permease [Kineothrix sedimenti]|uniref:Carbohydrate ABC transporter permease n=1 Tax=Kineothrix sedimenti TaxID=3123317 RepID=A0ABZ3EZ18_9FIRM